MHLYETSNILILKLDKDTKKLQVSIIVEPKIKS